MNKSIAILLPATGPYSTYLPSFLSTARKFLLPNTRKHFIVFTDNSNIVPPNPDLTIIPTPHESWPKVVLNKFQYSENTKHIWEQYDYVLLTNVNILFQNTLPESTILPTSTEFSCLTFDWHPKDKYPVERNPELSCYIPHTTPLPHYWQSGFIIAKSPSWKVLSETLHKQILTDTSQNKIAVWHDESYVNHFFQNKTIMPIHINVICPEFLHKPAPAILLDKPSSITSWKQISPTPTTHTNI